NPSTNSRTSRRGSHLRKHPAIRAITASRKPARRSSSACAIVPPTAAGFFTFVTQSNDHGGRLACPALHPIVITPGRPADQQHHPHGHDLQLPYPRRHSTPLSGASPSC